MRSLSETARQAAFAQESEAAWILLCTISHASLEQPIRVANDLMPTNANGESVLVSRGEPFVCYPFSVDLPADDGDSVSRVTIVIDNVDREIIQKLRSIQGPCQVALEVVLSRTPDLVEAGPFVMTLVAADYDALTISGELAFEDILSLPFPGDSYSPADYPGLF